MTATETANALEQKRGELKAKLDGWKNAQGQLDMKAADIKEFHDRHDEINQLGKDLEDAKAVEAASKANDAALSDMRTVNRSVVLPGQPAIKTLGQAFAEKAAGAEFGSKWEADLPVSFKSVMNSAAGWAPESLRVGRVGLSAQRALRLVEQIPNVAHNQAAAVFMQESTFTNAAAERTEGAAYGESALVYTQVTETLRSVGAILPVTDEELRDVAGLANFLDGRLTYQVMNRLDSQILNGTAVAPQIRGLTAVAGINTQAKAADTNLDMLFKGFQLIRQYGNEPTFVTLNPTDWSLIRLVLSTVGGVYLLGSPDTEGPGRVWGVPLVQSSAVAAGTGYAADASELELRVMDGVVIEIGYNGTDFSLGQKSVRATVRAALVAYKPKAITKFTGIA